MLIIIDQIRQRTMMPYRAIADAIRLPYPSLLRWRMRQKNHTPLIRKPGPQKIIPPDYGRLKQDIEQLSHGKSRTEGTGAVYLRHASSISRRQLQNMVTLARHDQNASHRQNLRRISWNIPNVAWSMDPAEYKERDERGTKRYLNQLQDLASRYKFSPMAGDLPCGEEIAGYLTETFSRFGSPLFLKRDNGGNLNHKAVNEVLSEHFVVPINSPVHYPPYNGAIEQAQAELKNGLNTKLSYKSCCPTEHLEAYASLVEHDLNHRPRPCLKGRNACQVYFRERRTFARWERRDAYVWITDLQNDIVGSKGVQPQAAWRIAVEAWLNMKGFITITIKGKVLPSFL